MRLSASPNKSEPIDFSTTGSEIKELLLRRAREKGSASRWNGYTLIVAYAVLAAITILELRNVSTSLVAILAACGLGAILAISRLQAKRIEAQSLKDEFRVYMELLGERPQVKAQTLEVVDPPPVESPLTDRELEVLKLIAEGMSNKEIALALHISDQTVKNHISHIFGKLEVSDRTSAVLMGIDQRWIKGKHTQSLPKMTP